MGQGEGRVAFGAVLSTRLDPKSANCALWCLRDAERHTRQLYLRNPGDHRLHEAWMQTRDAIDTLQGYLGERWADRIRAERGGSLTVGAA